MKKVRVKQKKFEFSQRLNRLKIKLKYQVDGNSPTL